MSPKDPQRQHTYGPSMVLTGAHVVGVLLRPCVRIRRCGGDRSRGHAPRQNELWGKGPTCTCYIVCSGRPRDVTAIYNSSDLPIGARAYVEVVAEVENIVAVTFCWCFDCSRCNAAEILRFCVKPMRLDTVVMERVES